MARREEQEELVGFSPQMGTVKVITQELRLVTVLEPPNYTGRACVLAAQQDFDWMQNASVQHRTGRDQSCDIIFHSYTDNKSYKNRSN